jgi:hypothetical protein
MFVNTTFAFSPTKIPPPAPNPPPPELFELPPTELVDAVKLPVPTLSMSVKLGVEEKELEYQTKRPEALSATLPTKVIALPLISMEVRF